MAPKHYSAYAVDFAAARQALTASAEGGGSFALPDPRGRLVEFDLVEDPVLAPELQAAHPEIRTYAGRATDGSGRTVRMDLTPLGLHASVRSPRASWNVDPAYDRRGEIRHLSYYRAAVPAPAEAFLEQDLKEAAEHAADEGPSAARVAAGEPVTRRTYRLAFVTDPTYAAYFGAANVLAAKTTLINRVNQPYNDDLAIRFELIADTNKLNLDTVAEASGPNGPCGANPCYDANVYQSDGTPNDEPDGCSGALLDRTTFVLGQIVGAESFDIGHIGLGVDGGGVARLGAVGGYGKAEGCTGLATPKGDYYAVDYFAHEVGHQMGGNHTFNGTQHNCASPNRNLDPYTTQVEPGSGSSIQGYAGICRQDNLQPHSDPYFSFISVEEISDTVADDSGVVDERQVVTILDPDGGGPDTGFDEGDAVTLSCAGCGPPVTIVNDAAYESGLTVAQAAQVLTGHSPLVGDYDAAEPVFGLPTGSPSNKGFTLEWAVDGTGVNIPRIEATVAAGAFSEFVGVTRQGGPTTNEGTKTPAGNNAPSVTAPADKTLPTRTPFTLTGSGSDQNGHQLTYMWEQTDAGGAQGTTLASNDKFEGPLFRVFGIAAPVTPEATLLSPSPGINLADGSPSRTFPDMAQVLAGHTNANTGTCPPPPADPGTPPPGAPKTPLPPAVLDCYSEFLPTQGYAATSGELNFRITARDTFPTGGGTAIDDVTLTVDPSAGPFLVTSRQAAGTPAAPGAKETVTWNVAGTNTAAMAQNVRIRLSIDGGASFPVVLADSTPNDGSQQITLPVVNTGKARYKIEAVGNYFFDTNDANFTIGNPNVAIDTVILKGPAKNSFVLSKRASFRLASTVPGSTFLCTFDRRAVPCSAALRLRLKPGTHRFTAAARAPGGLLDTTPAKRVFSAPFNDTALKKKTDGWTRHKDKRSYRGGWTEAHSKGQVLAKSGKKIKMIALVAHTGPGFGKVAVYLGDKRLKTIDLSGKKLKKRVLIKVASLKKRSGQVRIVTLTGKPVRIDGLGLLVKQRK